MTTFARLAKILKGEVAPKNWIEQAFKGVVDAIASAVAGNVPAIGDGDVGKFMRANSDKTPGWVKIITVPSIGQADKGKILYAGQNLTPVWGDNEVPTVGENDKDKYLHTNPITGTMEWVSVPLPLMVTITSTPTNDGETLTADYTVEQIIGELKNGRMVFADYSGVLIGLVGQHFVLSANMYDDNGVCFWGSNNSVIIQLAGDSGESSDYWVADAYAPWDEE